MSNAISEKGKIISGSQGPRGRDGLGIKSVDINQSNHLIVTYDDDTTHDAGLISGGSGGSDAFIITISGEGTEQNPYVANKTPAEVTEAVNAGKILYIKYGVAGNATIPVVGYRYSLHYVFITAGTCIGQNLMMMDSSYKGSRYNADIFAVLNVRMLGQGVSWNLIQVQEINNARPLLINSGLTEDFLVAENENKIAQYVGEDEDGFIKGHFYQCVEGETVDIVEPEIRSIGVKALTEPEPESDRHFVLKPIFVQPSALVIKMTRKEEPLRSNAKALSEVVNRYDFDKTPQEVAEVLHTYDGWSGVDVRLAYEEDDPYTLEAIPLTSYQFDYDDEDSEIIYLVFNESRVVVADNSVGTEVKTYTMRLIGNLTTNTWIIDEDDEATLTGTFTIYAMAIGVDQNQNPIIELDKTPAEVETAYEAGMTIELVGSLGDDFKAYLTSRSENGNYVDFYFSATSIYNETAPILQGGWMQARYNINDSSTWTAIYAQHLSFPWPQRTNMSTNNVPVGTIVQYTGTTDANYTNGYFYKRIGVGLLGRWERIDVQPSSGGGEAPINMAYYYLLNHNDAFYYNKDNNNFSVEVSETDYSITVDGTTDEAGFYVSLFENIRELAPFDNYIKNGMTHLSGKTLHISGCPSGGSQQTYCIGVQLGFSGEPIFDTGSGVNITIPSNSESLRVWFVINPNQTVSNLNIKPMICFSDSIPSEYISPYVPDFLSYESFVASREFDDNKNLYESMTEELYCNIDPINELLAPNPTYYDGYNKNVDGLIFSYYGAGDSVKMDWYITVKGACTSESGNADYYLFNHFTNLEVGHVYYVESRVLNPNTSYFNGPDEGLCVDMYDSSDTLLTSVVGSQGYPSKFIVPSGFSYAKVYFRLTKRYHYLEPIDIRFSPILHEIDTTQMLLDKIAALEARVAQLESQ